MTGSSRLAAALAVGLAAELETRLVHDLALEPRALAPDLGRATGRWKNAEAHVETRAWSGARVSLLRVARVEGAALAIGNVLCVPDPALVADGGSLPILGVDLVAIGERDTIVVADLSPTVDDRARGSERLAAALAEDAAVARLPRIADLPAWARESFSPAALAARVPAEQADVAAAAVRRAVAAFVGLVRGADVGGDRRAAHHGQRRYMERHRTEDGGLALLGRVFGDEWSARYIRELLFPDLPEPALPGPRVALEPPSRTAC